MDDTNKLPLKRVELSLTKFNEVAIPHHLDLLRQHKANILKYEECGDWPRVRSEQTHARRVAAQLRSLLAEVEALRRQVAPQDHTKFDAMTQRSRDLTLKSIVDYLETSPLSMNRRSEDSRQVAGSALSTDSVGVAPEPEPLQLQIDEHEVELQSREAVLRGWCELQGEVGALHAVWAQLHRAAHEQREQVARVDASIERADHNVEAARVHLSTAEWLRAGAYGAGGAAAGALLGGPLGLLLGAKAAAGGLLAGSALGYCAARALGTHRRLQIHDAPARLDHTDASQDDTKEERKTQ